MRRTPARPVLLIAAAVLPVAATPTLAQCRYEVSGVIDPPSCPPWHDWGPTIPVGIGDDGTVVGYSYIACRGSLRIPWRWTASTGRIELAIPEPFTRPVPWGASDGGAIAGWVTDTTLGRNRAFVETGDAFVIVEPLDPTGSSFAHDVEGGVVTGRMDTPDGHAAFRVVDGAVELLPPVGPWWGSPRAVNRRGDVAGSVGSVTPFHDTGRPIIWRLDGSIERLENPPRAISSAAWDLNDRGDVLVWGPIDPALLTEGSLEAEAPDDEGEQRTTAALRTGPGYGVIDPLPGAVVYVDAWSLNDAGQVVGEMRGDPFDRGYLWQKGETHDLEGLIEGQGAGEIDGGAPLGDYVIVRTARAINDRGQIACIGSIGGEPATMVLSPIDVPVGDADLDCRVDRRDLETVLALWGTASPGADLDRDGIVGTGDLLIVLEAWTGSTLSGD